MKKIINKSLFLLVFCFCFFITIETTQAATCTWRESIFTTATETGSDQMGTLERTSGGLTGGCKENEEVKNDSFCSSETKPEKTGELNFIGCCCEKEIAGEFKKTADLNPLGNLQIDIPGVKELADKYPIKCNTVGEAENCEIPWIAIYIYAIYNYMLAIGGVLAVVTIMIGGVIWLMSAGNASRISTAKSWITGSLTGLLILLTSYILLYQINPNLVDTVYVELRTITPLKDADITVIGGTSPYMKGCLASRKGDYSICKAYGNSEPSGLTTYKGKKIDTSVLEKYEAAMECVKQKNGKYLFYINEGWRSAATQISYKERGLAAAVPCCSNHGSGQAMDLKRLDGVAMSWSHNDSSGLKECMNAQGLYAKLTTGEYNEPWHWSPTGR